MLRTRWVVIFVFKAAAQERRSDSVQASFLLCNPLGALNFQGTSRKK
ncbi:MAG: hypothetical protein SPH02_00130 [Campylobacter sp.]|nr:hypothetical protein [Campylobacter sp.]